MDFSFALMIEQSFFKRKFIYVTINIYVDWDGSLVTFGIDRIIIPNYNVILYDIANDLI